jgi:hypothetical protein
MKSKIFTDSIKRILIIDFWSATPHLETSLEICLRLLKKRKKVYYMFLGDAVPFVECHWSTARVHKGLSTLLDALETDERNNFSFSVLDSSSIENEFYWPKFQSLQHLKLYQWEGKPIGISAISTIIDMLKSDDIDFSESDIQDLASKALTTFSTAYRLTTDALKTYQSHALVLFNGRFPSYAGSRYAASDQVIPVYFHERGSDQICFRLEPNPPHDYLAFKNNCLASIKRVLLTKPNIQMISDDWFLKRIKVTIEDDANITSYLNGAINGGISNRNIYSFFVSSTDEVASLPPDVYPNSFWPSQTHAICDLITALQILDPMGLLVVRLHPNMANKDQDQINRLGFLKYMNNVVMIEPDSSLNSYALASISKTVFTYMSTIGLESAFLGKHVVTMAPAYYDFLKVTHSASSYKQLIRLLKGKDSVNISTNLSSVRMRCSFYSTFINTPQQYYKYFRADGPNSGTFLGTRL